MEILVGIIIVLAAAVVVKLVRKQPQPENIEELRKIAESKARILPPKPFTTDGCTFFPDSFLCRDLSKICIEHDMQYWKGGMRDERIAADIKLREGVNRGLFPLGHIFYLAVRIFGHPKIPGPWRWGYGFDYPYPHEY